MNFINISHNDLDGHGSTILLKSILGNNGITVSGTYNVSNGKVDKTVLDAVQDAILKEEVTSIIITDVSVSEETAEIVDLMVKLNPQVFVTLLDHHKSAEWLNKYKWASVETEREGVLTSATSLLVDFLHLQGYDINLNEYSFAENVRLYDTWDWTREGKQLPADINALLYLVGAERFSDHCLEALADDGNILTDEFKLVLDIDNDAKAAYLKSKEKELVKHRFPVYSADGITSYEVGVVTVEKYHSELGNHLSTVNPELQFIMMWDVKSKKVSLRTTGDTDLSIIAKVFGGGGHKSAAGFPVTHEMAIALLRIIYKDVK